MAMARKGSRLIDVDGTVYRWMIRHKPTYSQGIGAPLTFAVEAADSPGQVLSVMIGSPRPDNWLEMPGEPVTPRMVAQSVRDALAAGWEPSRSGSQFRLELPG
jgi:hypothetical protein